MTPRGFEPAIPISDWLQTFALDRSAAEIGTDNNIVYKLKRMKDMTFFSFLQCNLMWNHTYRNNASKKSQLIPSTLSPVHYS
jgi:hypothetical protein